MKIKYLNLPCVMRMRTRTSQGLLEHCKISLILNGSQQECAAQHSLTTAARNESLNSKIMREAQRFPVVLGN